MSSYRTSTKTDNGKAINNDTPQYKGLTNNQSEEHKAFADQRKKQALNKNRPEKYCF